MYSVNSCSSCSSALSVLDPVGLVIKRNLLLKMRSFSLYGKKKEVIFEKDKKV